MSFGPTRVPEHNPEWCLTLRKDFLITLGAYIFPGSLLLLAMLLVGRVLSDILFIAALTVWIVGITAFYLVFSKDEGISTRELLRELLPLVLAVAIVNVAVAVIANVLGFESIGVSVGLIATIIIVIYVLSR